MHRRRCTLATDPGAVRITRVAEATCSPIWSCSKRGFPCRGLLPAARCALTAPFHPCQPDGFGGLFSVALSVGSRPPGVTWRFDPRSPDFPLHEWSDCLARSAFPRLPYAQQSGFAKTRAAAGIGDRSGPPHPDHGKGSCGARPHHRHRGFSSKHKIRSASARDRTVAIR